MDRGTRTSIGAGGHIDLVVAAILFVFCPPTAMAADEPDKITWLVIGEGPSGRTAVDDAEVDFLTAHMPEIEHQRLYVNTPRALNLIETEDGFCVPGIYKTEERSKVMRFSDPNGWSLPYRIILRKSSLPRIARHRTGNGRIRLTSLIADLDLRGARESGGSLGPTLDVVMKIDLPHVQKIVHLDSAYRMLAASRFDWIIGDASEAAYLIASLPRPQDYVSLAIAEQPNLLPYFTVCSDGPRGEKAIAGINRAIALAGESPPWQQKYVAVLDDVAQRDFNRQRAAMKQP